MSKEKPAHQRWELEHVARQHGIEVKPAMSDLDVMVAVTTKLAPAVHVFEGKSAAYIGRAYELAVEAAAKAEAEKNAAAGVTMPLPSPAARMLNRSGAPRQDAAGVPYATSSAELRQRLGIPEPRAPRLPEPIGAPSPAPAPQRFRADAGAAKAETKPKVRSFAELQKLIASEGA